GANASETVVERRRHRLVDGPRIVSGDDMHVVVVALEQSACVVRLFAGEHGRPADLVAVQMENREHRAVARRIQKARALPRTFERAGFGFTVPDHGGHDEIGIVERRAERVRQHVAQLSALMDRTGGGHADVARNAARRRELPNEAANALRVARYLRIDLAVRALEIDVRDYSRSAMAGAGEKDDVDVALDDDPIEMRVHEAQSGRRAPVAEQARLDVLEAERLDEQRIVLQKDLADGQIVGRHPVAVERVECPLIERTTRVAVVERSILRHPAASGSNRARYCRIEHKPWIVHGAGRLRCRARRRLAARLSSSPFKSACTFSSSTSARRRSNSSSSIPTGPPSPIRATAGWRADRSSASAAKRS